MSRLPRPCLLAVAAAAAALHADAWAVNGAQPGGIGIKNASMGGASIALPLDATAAANNPAGLAFVPSSATFGLQLFRGHSSAEYVLPGNNLDNRQTQPVPEGGINRQLDGGIAVGLSVSGAGAGSDYGQPALPVAGAGEAKTSLRVAEFVPALAYAPRPDLAVGLGLTLAWQQFEADGVIVPAPVPGGLMPLPGHGRQSATGIGVRAGLLWKPAENWTLGATARSRVRMSSLDGYERDLLAYSDGHLDVPAQYGVGVAWQATPRLTLAADWLRILWGEIEAMRDPNGFAWRNQPVLRLGAAWSLDDRWTLRAGISRNDRQIDSSRAVQNLLVPSIHDRAYSVGLSWRSGERSEINLGYELNPRTTLEGTGASAGTSLTSKVQMFLLGYHHNF
ncbi:OmpP1/FadL family transporter [Caldimonas sp. KR1-144]|uniref:OmpP1/FadL family transporter n=1 Tax=Caldimonas sp. KR1-144 TaxID=3400911 RepID=UPI003C0F9383